ncbi:hypothetical protein P3339_04065 [Microbulbifer sp. MLAF003]|uniref:hypothetical protein n=1 Tax=Microbulbifer sp. MLAF003 TaxID=3032582 RepID=UPI0024AC9881|nr:hypothetical protein [Microbulbifer sp. MLAF003]WHI52006.1 hypothetical protein P3339_04065 [Microbulbifer sp. MLAF003]
MENPTPVGGSWEKGNFLPVSTFTDRCVSPRSGTDPITGSAYADVLGTRQDENNWLRSMSNELYLWYDEIEDKDPARFDSSLTYFEELRTFALTPLAEKKIVFTSLSRRMNGYLKASPGYILAMVCNGH